MAPGVDFIKLACDARERACRPAPSCSNLNAIRNPENEAEMMKSICLAGLLAAAAALSAYPRPREKARRPNVVILFTDDQGTLDAGCYGSKDLKTPAIDSDASS